MKIPTSIVIIVWIMFCVALPITVCVIRQRKIQKILTQIIFCLFLLALLVGVLCDIRITQSTTNIDFDFEGQWCNKIVFWGIKTTRVDKMINLIRLKLMVKMRKHYLNT